MLVPMGALAAHGADAFGRLHHPRRVQRLHRQPHRDLGQGVGLKHAGQPSGGYFVTFGYSTMFTAAKPPTAGGHGSGGIAGNYVFFANEQAALTR